MVRIQSSTSYTRTDYPLNCGSEGQAESRHHGGDINGKSCKANRFEYDSSRTEKEHSRNINNASQSPQSKLVGTHIAKISFHFRDNESARLKIHQRRIVQMNAEIVLLLGDRNSNIWL